ncbi:MAG: response regulator [Cyanobacteria bacterium P01_A01_bin.45]
MKSQINKKPKILVVDDEPDNLDLLYRTFYREYKVLRASSGPDALDLLAKEGDVAVIISDQRMPMMSGTEFLSLTATQYPDIMRIILTGYTDVEDLVEAINSGKVFKYVTKPWEAEDLKAVVRQALDTHNVLKARTEELFRTLRQESLLNTVITTIRNALDYGQILQTIVDTVGRMLEVDVCLLRPFQDGDLIDEGFVYQQTVGGERNEINEIEDKGKETLDQQEHILSPTSKLPSSDILLAYTVWETEEVLVVSDVAQNEFIQGDRDSNGRRSQAFAAADIYSSLIVPLLFRKKLMAVLALHQRHKTRFWQEDEVKLVMMVADQAALALSQAYAYEQVHSLAKREALINTINSSIRSSLNPQDIYAAITQELGQALQVNYCILSLWTKEDEFVEQVALYESSQVQSMHSHEDNLNSYKLEDCNSKNNFLHQQLLQPKVLIEENVILQEILRTQEPLIISDINNYQSVVKDLHIKTDVCQSLMIVPLLTDGKIIGSITLYKNKLPRKWLASEIELTKAVAAQAAIAVQQSYLYQKTCQQAERLLELDKQKTEFFQNISHEFRTPITLIQGPLESAVSSQQGLSYPQSNIALRNSRRLLRLVNQLLDLQRLDAGKMRSSFRPCDLVKFVSQIVESFRPYCEKKKLNLITDFHQCPMIYLDMEKFDKVVYNLLSNAMKFTPESGNIIIRIKSDAEKCILQVQDTGIGIKKEQMFHLFERFRQAEGSENRSYEGTGLGLALVKELVEVHGGEIAVDSEYGEGTQFTISLLPGTAHLHQEQIVEDTGFVNIKRANVELADLELLELIPADNLDSLGHKNELSEECDLDSSQNSDSSLLLVVDDNPDLRSYVSDILKASGYRVITARNGSEGFNVAKEFVPHLIITDLMMPVVTGIQMIEMIRQEIRLRGVPIVLLTAKVDDETRIEGTEHGADAYLAKPFNDRELLAEVKNLLALKENEQRVVELNTYLTQSVLKRFLPPVLVNKAATGDLVLDLQPEPRLITVLFSDIVGFTQLANTLRSRKISELLNEYLEAMTKAVFDNGGTVDKFMGDAILALFGAPEELTPNEQARRAVNTARAMLRSLEKLNQSWYDKGLFDTDGRDGVKFRCGIHQGTAVVGMFGSSERADYTAIGPSVNIAARLQQAAQPGSIIVSAAVADYLEDEEITKGDSLELKGVDETVLTFTINTELVVNR